MLEVVQRLAKFPDSNERNERLHGLVTCPQPLMSLFSEHYAGADLAMRQLILECLVRRYYYYRPLEDVRVLSIEGHSMALADYEHEGERFHVLATLVSSGKIEAPSHATRIGADGPIRRRGQAEPLQELART